MVSGSQGGAEAYRRKWHDAGKSDKEKLLTTIAAATIITTRTNDTKAPRDRRGWGWGQRSRRGEGGGGICPIN